MTDVNRRLVKIVTWVLLAVFLLLTVIASVIRSDALFNLAIVALMGMVVIELAFNRCPHCRAYVGRSGGKYCPQCGESLEE